MKQTLFLVILGFGLISSSKANTIKVESETALWSALLFKYELNHKFYLHNELRYRVIEQLNNPQQLVLRPSAHYQPLKWLTLGFGYSYILGFPYGRLASKIKLPEHHIFQEIKTNHEKTGRKISLQTRFRFEERFIAMPGVYTPHQIEGYQFANRLRSMLQVSFKLKKWTLSVYDELFTQGKKGGLESNQNWLGFNISHKFSNSLSASLGYMNMFLDRRIPLTYESHHILRLAIKLNLHRIICLSDF